MTREQVIDAAAFTVFGIILASAFWWGIVGVR